jgi:transcriptional regulator with XRE-family HTH domain
MRRLKPFGVKVSANTVGRWLSGQTKPDIAQAKAFADLLGLSLDYLTNEGEDAIRPVPKDEAIILEYARDLGYSEARRRLIQAPFPSGVARPLGGGVLKGQPRRDDAAPGDVDDVPTRRR